MDNVYVSCLATLELCQGHHTFRAIIFTLKKSLYLSDFCLVYKIWLTVLLEIYFALRLPSR